MPSRKTGPVTFDLAGAQTLVQVLPSVDFSWADGLEIILAVTRAEHDVGDTLDVKFQQQIYPGHWDTRARFVAVPGDTAQTPAAPLIRVARVAQWDSLDEAEEMYIPTCSSDGSELSAGTVRNGLLAGRSPGSGDPANDGYYRFVFIVTDAGTANAHFTGSVDVYAVHRSSSGGVVR